MAQNDRTTGLVGNAACKVPCRVATTAAITLAGLQTVDGVVLVADDRVLVKDQADTTQNGIWIADTGDWNRSKDCDGPYDVVRGSIVHIVEGTLHSGDWFELNTSDPVIGETALSFTATFLGSASTVDFVQAGAGAVTRTSQNKMRDIFAAKDFGVVADGLTNDTAAWATAVAAAIVASAALFHPGGISLATVSMRGNDVAVYGPGSSVATIKHPNVATTNVLELGDTASGNAATAYSGITVRGLTLDGNRAVIAAPATDLVGHGLPLTKISDFHLSDVRVVNCHNAGVGIFINSNYGFFDVYVENCGNVTTTGPGFDINSSKYLTGRFVSKDCYDGGRVLDNCWGCEIVGSVTNATRTGFIYNNQSTNESYNNDLRVTVDTCGGNGWTIGPNCHDSNLTCIVKSSGDTGVNQALQTITTKTFDGSSAVVVDTVNNQITIAAHGWTTGHKVNYSPGSGGTAITGITGFAPYWIIRVDNNTVKLASSAANASAGTAIALTAVGVGASHTLIENLRSQNNTITVNTSRSANASVFMGGDANIWSIVSREDGRGGAVGACFAVDVNGNYNILKDVFVHDSDPWHVRGVVFRAGATENTLGSYKYLNTLDPLNDGGTRTRYMVPKTMVAVTSARAVLGVEYGTTFTNEGAAALVAFTLPGAALQTGPYTFIVQDADGIRVTAAAGDTIRLGSSVSAVAGRIDSVDIGSTVTIIAINATEWMATSIVGTWTVT